MNRNINNMCNNSIQSMQLSSSSSSYTSDMTEIATSTNSFVSASSLKRRRLSYHPGRKQSSWMSFTQAMFLLLVAVCADDNAPSSPQSAIIVTPTPVSSPATSAPIALPTSRPAASPTLRPTLRPFTESPTEPTLTDSPTPSPTIVVSSNPTESKSDSPTIRPSIAPSNQSSEAPSISPKPVTATMRPTVSPAPTRKPTTKPTTRAPVVQKPTQNPNRQPTTTNRPSASPSDTPQDALVNVDVILSRTLGNLDGKSYFDFEAVTETFILNQLKELDFDTPVNIINVQTNIYEQNIEKSNRLRKLQSSSSSNLIELRVRYNALVVYQSDIDNENNVPEWIGQTFNTKQKRELYISRLQTANSNAFGSVDNIVVLVEGTEPPEVTPIDEKSTNEGFFSNENLWYIIGAVGGFISLIIMVSTLYVIGRNKKRKQQDDRLSNIHGGKQNMTTVTKIKNQFSYDSDDLSPNKHYTAEIDVDLQNDDVSTLGDPTYYGGAPDQPTVAGIPSQNMMMMMDPKYNSSNNNSDNPSGTRDRLFSEETEDDVILFSESNLSKQNDDIVVHTVIDDSSLDIDDNNNNINDDTAVSKMNRYVAGGKTIPSTKGIVGGSKYVVEVPPGKLGMIIDTPDNGPPIVHTVKPESILCTIVRSGDYLITVDDENVTHMTAVQVSKLISMKSDQQRTFTFLRKKDPTTNTTTTTFISSSSMNRNVSSVPQQQQQQQSHQPDTFSVSISENDIGTEHSGAC